MTRAEIRRIIWKLDFYTFDRRGQLYRWRMGEPYSVFICAGKEVERSVWCKGHYHDDLRDRLYNELGWFLGLHDQTEYYREHGKLRRPIDLRRLEGRVNPDMTPHPGEVSLSLAEKIFLRAKNLPLIKMIRGL